MMVRNCTPVFIIFSLICIKSVENFKNWIAPNAWGKGSTTNVELEKDSIPSEHDCQLQNLVLSNVLKKLFSFSEYEKSTDPEYLIRDFHFKVTENQLIYLNEAEWDMKDLLKIVSDILEQSKNKKSTLVQVFSNTRNIIERTSLALSNPDTFFYSSCVIFIVMSYILSKYYKIKFWIICIILLLVISYSFKYKTCNDKLQADFMIKMIDLETQPDYCKMASANEQKNFFLRLFYPSNADKCKEQIRTRYSEKLEFCDPIEVAVGMIATLQFRYIQIVATQCVDLYTSLTESSGWISKLIFAGFFMLLITIVFRATISGFFKFMASPNAMASINPFTGGESHNNTQHNEMIEMIKLQQAHVKLQREIITSFKPQNVTLPNSGVEELPFDETELKSLRDEAHNLSTSKCDINNKINDITNAKSMSKPHDIAVENLQLVSKKIITDGPDLIEYLNKGTYVTETKAQASDMTNLDEKAMGDFVIEQTTKGFKESHNTDRNKFAEAQEID